MSNITSFDDLVNTVTLGGPGSLPQNTFWYKTPFVAGVAAAAPVAGRVTSLWQYAGSPSAPTANPGAVSYPTSTTTGSLPLTNASSANGELWLVGAGCVGSESGMLLVYDRLAHISGLNATTVTLQTVSASAMTRYTGSACIGNQIWLEVYTQIGVSTSNLTVQYVNQNGAIVSTPTASFGNTNFREAQRFMQIPLAPGDTGVQQVLSLILVPTTGTAGDFGVTVIHPLAWVPVQAFGSVRDMVMDLPSITKIQPNACLSFAFLSNTTTAIEMMGNLKIIEK